MGERRFTISASGVINTQTFFARQALISNLLPRWLFFRIGGTDTPTADNCDWAVAPMTCQVIPLPATNVLGVGVGAVVTTLGQQVISGQAAILTLYDQPLPTAIGSIDLNPTRLGQMVQQKFVAAQSYTIAFPVTTVHVANYSQAWVYVKFGSLVTPTAATADIAIPPMSEKSLTCTPATQFAFGLSAALVTTGQQIPAGVQIIATFFEYPTPVSVGTADLNPSKMGQMTQQKFTTAQSYTIAFPVTTVHVANYSQAWVYVKFGSLVTPTAATADVAIPPMSEKSLTCVPATQFAFGLSAALVTTGQQIPAGVQIIATFFEYPTPVSVGTADLNPSKMGQMVQQKFVAAQSYTIAFPVTTVHVANYSQAWVYVKFGSLVTPTAATADIAIPPMSEKSLTCTPATQFAFGLSAALVTTGQQIPAGVQIIATFFEYPTPVSVGTADLNPSKMGQMTQQKFTTAQSYTIAFPVTTVHVANYSQAWVYVKFGSLVTPTAATADVAIPPMSEKSLTCVPATQFAFGLSAALVTTGQQIPAGVQIIATFFEYPTPVSVGTADLNPSKMGQSSQVSVVQNTHADSAFPVTQIHVANYMNQWMYLNWGLQNTIGNPGFESGITVWVPHVAGSATITASGVNPHSGAVKALLQQPGVGDTSYLTQDVVLPAGTYRWLFWTHGDGANSGGHRIYNVSLGADVVAATYNNVVGVAWEQVEVGFTLSAAYTVRFILYGAVDASVSYIPGTVAYDDNYCQIWPTAANCQTAVGPMTEKSLPTLPVTSIDFGLGAQTVMASTSVPITRAIATLYEYTVPINLGATPLSPGGFRYSSTLRNNAVITNGTATGVIDLSNFNSGRYTMYLSAKAGAGDACWASIYNVANPTYPVLLGITHRHGSTGVTVCVEFQAGCPIKIVFSAMSGLNFTITDILEGW